MLSLKLGFAPTRRSIFSAPDALKFAGLTKKRLEELGVSLSVSTGSMKRDCYTMTAISTPL